MFKRFSIALLPAILLLLVIGCSDNSVEPQDATSINFEDEFGGYDSSDEPAAFGDQALLAAAAEEEMYDDPILTDSLVDTMYADPDAGLYRLRVIWGQLQYDSTHTAATDWSGSLTISRGAEVVRRLIRFEPGQDYLEPRTDRRLIEWVSVTTVHNDGLVVDLLVPPARPIFDTSLIWVIDSLGDSSEVAVVDTIPPDLTPVSLKFETGPYSAEFSMEEIAKLDTIVTLDDSNAVFFQGMRFDHIPCPRGFLVGHWGWSEDGVGRFRGIWYSRGGLVDGYVEGHYGINVNGRKLFFGKWITESGKFAGYLKGSWQPHASTDAAPQARIRSGGSFWGSIYNDSRQEIGQLRGKYRHSAVENEGMFMARWKVNCRESSADDSEKSQDGF